MTIEHREFCFGRKNLSLDINTEAKTASVRFGTQEPSWLHPKKIGETTTIFKMADVILQQRAEEAHESYTLFFDTSNSNLKKWIHHNNDQLQFTEITPEDPSAYHIRAIKIYSPKNI